jgi:DNA-binding IclR family transcriptional regulator
MATTYRIVACLASEGLVEQRVRDRRYVPGQLMFELSLAVPAYEAFRAAMRPQLTQLARQLDSIAFLFIRSINEVVCIDRVGSSSAQPLTIVGTRRPMAESTAGIAMLLSLPPDEQKVLLGTKYDKWYRSSVHRISTYRKILQHSRKCGYGLNRGNLVAGLAGIAVPILDHEERPFSALSVTGPTDHLLGDNLERARKLLFDASRKATRQHAALIAALTDYRQR